MNTENTLFDLTTEGALADQLPEGYSRPIQSSNPIRLNEEDGQFLLSSYGEQMALGFKGSPEFIQRCHNWAENTCVIGRGVTLHWFYGEGAGIGYVCPPTKQHIIHGLELQFRSEIIGNREIPLLKEEWDDENGLTIEYDEDKIEALAKQRTEEFMQTKMKHDLFLTKIPGNVAPIFEYVSPFQGFGGKDED